MYAIRSYYVIDSAISNDFSEFTFDRIIVNSSPPNLNDKCGDLHIFLIIEEISSYNFV